MKRLCPYLLALMLCCQSLNAGGGSFLQRFHPGIEWGFSPMPAEYHHYNYLDQSIGFRINDKGWSYPCHLNAFILAGVSFDLSPRIDIAVLSGYKNQKYGRQTEAGAGYMLTLAPHCSLVFRIGGRVVYDRPDVWDPIEEEYISARNIKRNDAWYYALNLGVGLYF